MNKRHFAVGTFGVVVAIASVIYGCSDDKPAPGVTGTTPEGGGTPDNAVPDQNSPGQDTGADTAPTRYTAHADIRGTFDGSVANGTATFTEENGEVTVVVDMTKAFPPGSAGMHGMHIHQNGSCGPNDSGADGAIVNGGAAGAHWNPLDAGHGFPTAAVHHAGDMGNIIIADGGTGKLTLVSKEWTVQSGAKSVVGHAVVFHIQADDGTSQPVGDAGSRPGCGVIVTP
jgi:Cu-Zn family superoxide dismutase